jgi:hypothetical protein
MAVLVLLEQNDSFTITWMELMPFVWSCYSPNQSYTPLCLWWLIETIHTSMMIASQWMSFLSSKLHRGLNKWAFYHSLHSLCELQGMVWYLIFREAAQPRNLHRNSHKRGFLVKSILFTEVDVHVLLALSNRNVSTYEAEALIL